MWRIRLGVLAIGGIAAAWGAFNVGQAESSLGDPTVTRIEAVAHAAVNENYRDGGWGDSTCYAFQANRVTVTDEAETVWDDRLDSYYDDHPEHEYRTRLGEHPSLADVARECA